MTPEEITAVFATAATTYPPITGQPTDDDLTAMKDILYPLLLDIPYNDPDNNLIGIIEPLAAYIATWGQPFPIPAQPPAYPAIADNATAVVRARSEAEHALLLQDYASYDAAERAVAKFIREAVDEIWYRDLRHARSFYTSVTAVQLLDHLDANCGGLHPSELVNLPTEMMGYYALADGSKIEDCMLTRICNESSKPWTWQSLDPEPGLTFLLIHVAEEDPLRELPGLVSHGSGNSLQLLS